MDIFNDGNPAPKVVVGCIMTSLAMLLGFTIWRIADIAKATRDDVTVSKFKTKEDAVEALCTLVVATAKLAIQTRGSFTLAVAGGSLLDALGGLTKPECKSQVDWSKVTLVYANHKCHAPTDPSSTHAKALKIFAASLGMKTVAPSPTPEAGGDGSKEAAYYERTLRESGNFSPIDLVILGLGGDGHVASLHPNSDAVFFEGIGVIASTKPGLSSITFSMDMINQAGGVVVFVTGGGSGKKEAVSRALYGYDNFGEFPAQSLKTPMYILDKEAAAAI